MRSIFLLLILSTHMFCKTLKMNKKSEKSIEISILDLKNLSKNECLNVKTLFLFDSVKVAISPDVINYNIIEREVIYNQEMSNLKYFKNLKYLYFVNIYMTDIHKDILSLENLEELQFNFLNQEISENQVSKFLKLKKLKKLIINNFFIGDANFNLVKKFLSKSKIKVESS